jgi:hypothetical protein
MELRDSGDGVTRESLAFYRDHRHEMSELARVTVRFPAFGDPYDPYLMVLTDRAANRMLLSGCTTGYVGEGPNGALEILVAEGVPIELALTVNDGARVCFTRTDGSWCMDHYAAAQARDPADDLLRSLDTAVLEATDGRYR